MHIYMRSKQTSVSFRTTHITKKHLSKPKEAGGFSSPNFKMYYWAAQSLSILAWWRGGIRSDTDSCPAWLHIESSICKKTSLLALLHSLTAVKRSLFSNSFVVGNTLKIWKQIKSYIKALKIYLDTPICENHSFTPGLTDSVFSTWKQSSICTIGDLYVNGNFASFAQL